MREPDWVSDCGRYRLYNADCRDVLPLAEPAATAITDPPYDLTANKKGGSGPASASNKTPAGRARITTGFMGKSWDGTGVAFDPATWVKVLDSLKPGGMLLAFGGTRTYHRMTCAIEDAGFEIRDCLAWMYGQGFPKSLNFGRSLPGWSGYGTALKPAYEPIVLAMKPLDGTFAENAQQYGVAGLNIDGGRIAVDPGGSDDPRLGGNGKWRTDKAAQNIYEGGFAGEDQSSNPLGRWPANVILDESAGEMLDEQVGPQHSGGTPARRFARKTKHAYGDFNGQENPNGIGRTSGFVSRFFYCAKASAADRRGSKHPTIKPLSLIEYLCRLTLMPTDDGGTVLDPFAGSGTTLEACIRLDRPCIAIEQDKEHGYFADCIARAEAAIKERKGKLFA
jgi:site-specific DNA-methyltransferase (adenine-specific)